MRNKKDLHIASCLEDLEASTKLPDRLKKLDLMLYVKLYT